MSRIRVNPKITVNTKSDGVVITVEGFELEVTVRSQWRNLGSSASMGEQGQPLESLRRDLEPYLKDLDITETVEGITVKPKRFLGRDFSPIAEIVEYYGGSYVSSGRESRFIIPLKETHENDSPVEEQ